MNYTFSLSSIYAGVGPRPIYHLHGFINTDLAKESALNRFTMNTEYSHIHFLNANKLFAYLWRNWRKHKYDVITLVIPGLREIYYNHKEYFDNDLIYTMDEPEVKFMSAYAGLGNLGSIANMNEYQLFGNITKYDVLHINVPLFVDLINNMYPITFKLSPSDIKIVLIYTTEDLYDIEYQKPINTIKDIYEDKFMTEYIKYKNLNFI